MKNWGAIHRKRRRVDAERQRKPRSKPTASPEPGTVGLQVDNVHNSTISVQEVAGFDTGIKVADSSGVLSDAKFRKNRTALEIRSAPKLELRDLDIE